MLWTLTMILPRNSIGWRKFHILARDAKRMKMCGKSLGVSWWIDSLENSLAKTLGACGLGTSQGTPFTMILPLLFHTLNHSMPQCPHLSLASLSWPPAPPSSGQSCLCYCSWTSNCLLWLVFLENLTFRLRVRYQCAILRLVSLDLETFETITGNFLHLPAKLEWLPTCWWLQFCQSGLL